MPSASSAANRPNAASARGPARAVNRSAVTFASVSWQLALSNCNALSLGGRNDWHLASVNELKSIVDYRNNFV